MASTVIGMLGKCPEAQDVGQEVFLRFYRSINAFREEASVGTYLTRIAINLSINELKRRRRHTKRFNSTSGSIEGIAEAHDGMEEVDNIRVVMMGLEKLKPKFREVVVLRLLKGYSTEETAEILKIPLGTVLSRLARAQRMLREILHEHKEGDDG